MEKPLALSRANLPHMDFQGAGNDILTARLSLNQFKVEQGPSIFAAQAAS